MYATWNIWHERNRRIVEGWTLSQRQVFGLIKEEIHLRRLALLRIYVKFYLLYRACLVHPKKFLGIIAHV